MMVALDARSARERMDDNRTADVPSLLGIVASVVPCGWVANL